MISYIAAVFTAVFLLIADQVVKYVVVSNLALYSSTPLIDGLLNINYIYNTGGAWGILSGHRVLLIVITVIVMAVCIVWLILKGRKNKWLFWAVSLILSGGLGNMIDRIFRGGKVVDFLQFDFWQSFPVFNIADCGIVVGCGILILYLTLDTIKEGKEKKANANS